MKRVLFILFFLAALSSGRLYGQHYVGVRAGWGGGTSRFLPAREMGYEWGLYSGGIMYKYYSETRFVGGVEVDLQYMQKGFKYDLFKDSDTSYHRRMQSIELPLIWQPHFYFAKRHLRFFINLGVQFSYNFGSDYELVSKRNGVLESGSYPFLLTRDNRWGYGLLGGAGFSVLAGRFEVLVEGRYYFGYSDILRNKTKYETNPVRSPLDNINISIGICYRLGKGGIKAPPGKKVAAKIEEAEARRAIRRMERKGIPVSTDDGVAEDVSPDSTTVTGEQQKTASGSNGTEEKAPSAEQVSDSPAQGDYSEIPAVVPGAKESDAVSTEKTLLKPDPSDPGRTADPENSLQTTP